jgi:predicted AAA+ superfamily ATPase
MYPLDFEEFLWATGRTEMVETIKSHRRDLVPFGAVHRKITEAFREYMVVGGMPQAVSCWAETHDLKKVEAVKKRIIRLYRNDIRKHAGRYAIKAEAVFDEIPAQLQEHDKKFRLAAVDADARMREYGDAFLWLKDAMIVNVAYNSTEPTAGLKLSAEYSTLKCYLADTGLLISHAFGSNAKALDGIVRRVMFDSISINEGMLVENAVAQMLVSQGIELFFYARYDKKNAENRMEIDFLLPDAQITRRKHVSAVEVKSENDYTTSSLDKFRRKFGQSISAAYVVHPGDIRQQDGILYMPVYMTPWIAGVHGDE